CAYADAPRAPSRCRCDEPASSAASLQTSPPGSLSARVALRWGASPSSRPSFPRSGPCSRCRSSLRRVPSARFPCFLAPIAALRLPVRPSRLARAHLAVPLGAERAGPPKFLGKPLAHVPRLFHPGGPPAQASGTSSLRVAPSVLPSGSLAPSASTTFSFRSLHHGPRARCLRFAPPIARMTRKTRFWLAALPWPDGT